MVNQVAHGNLVTDTYAKDPNDMGRPYRISTSNALANWNSGIFEYDGAGSIKALRGMSEPVARPAATHQDYTYDAFANLTRITLNDTTYQDLPTSASTNRLTGSGYDPSGNMTAWGGYTYTYDPLDAMTVLTGGTLSKAYTYDADGERLSFREGVSGPWTYSLRGLDGKVLREYVLNGTTWSWSKDLVYRQGQLLAAIDGSGTRHFTLDHLGSPRLITDAGRNVVEYHAYWGYGAEIDTACGVERMKFTGHERDNQCTAGMLDYMHARYYNPTIGRFLGVDQGNGNAEAPGSWNRYAYARGNPVKYVDPDGRVIDTVLDIGFIAMDVADIAGTLFAGERTTRTQWAALGGDVAGAFIPFATGIGAGIRALNRADNAVDALRTLDRAANARDATVAIYRSLDAAGNVQYVGFTKDFARRAAFHLRSKGIEIEQVAGLHSIPVADKRAVEQALMEIHKLGKEGGSLIWNKINSIAKANPKYAEELERGMQWLRQMDYPGVRP